MIEAENLIPYLPYSLKVEMEGKICNVAWMSTKNIAVHKPGGIGDYKKIRWKYAHLNIKPILKPLTELKDGMKAYYGYPNTEMFEEDVRNRCVSYQIMNELLQNKYDVFSLIERGLAVAEKIKEKASMP